MNIYKWHVFVLVLQLAIWASLSKFAIALRYVYLTATVALVAKYHHVGRTYIEIASGVTHTAYMYQRNLDT